MLTEASEVHLEPCQTSITNRSSHTEVYLGKDVLKICSKFIGEHPCRNPISIKLHSNFIENKLRHGCLPVNFLHMITFFTKNTSERLLLDERFYENRSGF